MEPPGMGRPMKRGRPLYPAYRAWLAVEDRRGYWIVVDAETREEPLRAGCPYERMLAVHRAAAAPAMVSYLSALLPRLESSRWADQDRRYRHLTDFGWAALGSSKPVGGTLARILPARGVLELSLETLDNDEHAA
jgi:hypothetical protein